jgi:RNase H-fold protein (predicted Holliday junction resolvase)
MDNIYVVDFNKRGTAAPQKTTNILQEKGDKEIILGMPMHPQEEENDEQEENE